MSIVRVLHVVGNMDYGGVETLLMNLYRSTDRRKVQYDFLCHNDVAGKFDPEITELGGKIIRVPGLGASSLPRYQRALRNTFEHLTGNSIVHAHLNRMNGIVLREAKRAMVPFRISHSHNSNHTNGFLRRSLYSYSKTLIKRSATHLMACSADAAAHAYSGELLQETAILPNAIDTEYFSSSDDRRGHVRDKLGLSETFVLGHVGSFTPQKNHPYVIEVFHRVYKEDKRARLLLVGVGSMEDQIKHDVEARGLGSAVMFLGPRADVRDLMDAMDLFIFPSRWEGLGIVAVEAQSIGLPVLASEAVPRESALTDLISYLPLDEPTTWAKRILAIIQSKPAHSRRDYNVEIARAGYDIKQVARELQDLYVRLGEGKPNGGCDSAWV